MAQAKTESARYATNHAALYRNLIDFQSKRLRGTYSDFVRSERFAPITNFFFGDVYSAEDARERDAQFKSLYHSFRSKLGERITHGIGELVELNDLSRQLDLRLVDELWERLHQDTLDAEDYEEAYRRCDNYDVRVRQIEMLCRSIRYFRGLASRLTIGLILRTVLSVANLLGGSVVIGFLKRGYDTFRSVTVEEVETFVQAVHDRELGRLNRIYRRPGWEEGPDW